MKRKAKQTINPNTLKTRDQLMVALINGVTKAGVQKDHRKEQSRRACRSWKADE